MYQDPEYDKYTFKQEADVDCESRLDVCKAVCCKLPFALSKQDVEEGIIRWEFGRPYLIAHGDDGYCVHLDRIPTSAKFGNTEQCHAGDLIAGIMNDGIFGSIMRRGFSIPSWWTGLRKIIVKSTLLVYQINSSD